MEYKRKTIERKLAEGARVCRISAEQGDVKAETNLAYMYSHGQGVPQDYIQAVRWYRKAADRGDARGQDGLAYMYSHGQGVVQDYAEAVRWYRKAADQGDTKGQDSLAYMYSHGQGVPQDYAEAVFWCRKAADQGYAPAEYSLGNMYYYGRGLPQDHAEAVRWYRKAADQGDEYALRALSAPLTIFVKFTLLGQFLLGLWLPLPYPAFNSLARGKNLRDFRQRALTGAGALCIFSAGLAWYGYTHYMMRCLVCGYAAFTLFRWLVDAVVVALLIYIVRSGKRSGPQQNGTDSSDTAAGSDGGTES